LVAVIALLLGASALAETPPDDSEVQALNADIDRLYGEGRFADAIPLAERALSIQERALGPDDPGVVKALNNLALLYRSAGDYVGAEALFERVLEITIEALGPDDPAVAITVNNLGMVYWEQGDRTRAAKHLEKALEIWQKAHGPSHPRVAVSLNTVASLYLKLGDPERAGPLYEKALAIWEKTPDPLYDQLIDTQRNLASIRRTDADFADAESILERSLAVVEKIYGLDHPETAVALSQLASLYFEAGDFARAKPLLERALAITETAQGPDHLDVSSALTNLASIYVEVGEYAIAEPLYVRALAIRSETLGDEHLAVAAALENLVSLYRAMREYERARPLCERALTIRARGLGPEHLDVARITSALGEIRWALGEFAKAEPLFERALLVREKVLGTAHPLVATSVDHVASAYLVRGYGLKANSLYEVALLIREKAFGRDHPAVGRSLRNLGLSHWQQHDWRQAEIFLERAADAEEREISLLLPVESEGRMRAAMEGFSNTTDLILSFQQRHPSRERATRLALTTVFRRKGRELGVAAMESAAGRQGRLGDSEREILDPTLAKRRELARRIVHGGDRPRSNAGQASVETLRREVDALENSAANTSTSLHRWLVPIEIEDIQAKLPADAALIEMVEYRDLDPTQITTDLVHGVVRLGAFVLRSAGEPRWIPLGEAGEVKASIGAHRETVVDPEVPREKERARARDLYDRLVAPLEAHLEGIRTVWVAPAGEAARVPFAALIDADGRYWIEDREIVYLTSGRDLLQWDDSPSAQSSPLVMAAPDYEAAVSSEMGKADSRATRFVPETAALHFEPISLSETGAAEIGRMLNVTPLTGKKASAAALEAVASPRVLHIATDAFILPDTSPPPTLRWGSILGVDSRLRASRQAGALSRAGLALAGANRRGSDAYAGLLLAREAAGLDLRGTQLVSISSRENRFANAADPSEVVLRRSLVIAGAQSQFVNLWSTEPNVARELTASYYERLLAGGGRSEALRAIQLEMLRSDRHSHPFYWAPFITIGARGSIAWEEGSGTP
jgi:tetratricopeptide (TPR) repeat protein/CHAT domain-containing protein